jgi:ferrous iron transport protein A
MKAEREYSKRGYEGLTFKTLAELEIGVCAKVVRLEIEGSTRRRLLDLGFLPGAQVKSVLKSPLGTPIAYEIRGSLLSLRKEDTSKIIVKIEP